MKIPECERGHNDASGEAIAWLHAEALRTRDPHARQILNNVAFSGLVAGSGLETVALQVLAALFFSFAALSYPACASARFQLAWLAIRWRSACQAVSQLSQLSQGWPSEKAVLGYRRKST